MHQGKLVFAQLMAHLPLSTFRRCVARYDGEHKVKSFSCLDQFYAMAFAQLTFRESLRDIEACLAAQAHRLYHLGFRSPVARNTLANANAVRPWRIYADLAQQLIGIARFFVIRAKRNLRFKRRYSQPVDRVGTRVLCDQIGTLEIYYSRQGYPSAVRRVVSRDEEGQRVAFLTNNTSLAPQTIGELYRLRWQVELFFKWIKQHLRIKAFFGTSENAVKTQIWIAVATYVLIAIVKKRAMLPHSLYELLQILSLTMFETAPTNQLLAPPPPPPDDDHQLVLL
jgi:hypothetical protein